LTKSFWIRNETIKSLCSSICRFRGATIKEECKSDYPHAVEALDRALDRGAGTDSELRPVWLNPSSERFREDRDIADSIIDLQAKSL
jgi:hypothetical protein